MLVSTGLLFIAASALPALVSAGGNVDNPYVAVEATLLSDSVHIGEPVNLLLSFTPARGIHVTGKPAVAFILDSSIAASLLGPPTRVVDSATGFLSLASPVRQQIALRHDMRPGPHMLKGVVSYSFCSEREGWCRRFRQHVELPLVVID